MRRKTPVCGTGKIGVKPQNLFYFAETQKGYRCPQTYWPLQSITAKQIEITFTKRAQKLTDSNRKAGFFKSFASRIDYVQFRDVRKPRPRKGRPQELRPATFGRGAVRLQTVARQVEAMGYSGWVTIEVPGPHADPVSVASDAREVARKVLGLA